MKSATLISRICGILAAVLLVTAIALSVLGQNAPVRLLSAPRDAEALTVSLMDALCRGDYQAAGSLMYGKPDLDAQQAPDTALGRLLWDAFTDSLSYTFPGSCYATDSGVARDVTVTYLDIPSVMEPLNARAQAILEQQLAAADAQAYDENGTLREDFVSQIMCQAAQEVLSQGDYRTETTVTLNLFQQEGKWWILPDQALIRVISGGVAG